MKFENSRQSEEHFQPITTFILKTYAILASPENAQAIQWKPQGRSFVIKNITKFTQSVLPEHFRHHKFQSFIRQLNMYNFSKIKSPEGPCFVNPFFQRDREDLLKYIKRKPEKKKRKTEEELQNNKENQSQSFKLLEEEYNEMNTNPLSKEFQQEITPELIKQKQSQSKVGKKVSFNQEIKDQNEQNWSTLIQPSQKWLNSKEETYWQNLKSFKSFRISLKLLSFNEQAAQGEKQISEQVKEEDNEIMTLKHLELC